MISASIENMVVKLFKRLIKRTANQTRLPVVFVIINLNPNIMKNNMVGWFEVPVTNMERAIAFYEKVF